MRIIRLIILILACASFLSLAENAIKADPDFICTGIDYAGVNSVKIGDYLQLRHLEAGGFLEVRDEKYFNTKFLPNHNWRGHFFLFSHIITEDSPQKKIYISLGYEHESAHPTMGIKEATTNAYRALYDDYYRNINLNSLLTRYNRIALFGQNRISGKLDYQFYFNSNNTPELIGNTSSVGHGLSGGLEYTRIVTELASVYIAAFDRYIFKGKKKTTGAIYYGKGDTFEQRTVAYPIMNEVNTITGKTGLLLSINKIQRVINVYFGVLYGNLFGFVDSRDKRLRFSGGICIYQDTR